jgi:hypothetical protein
MDFSSDDSSLDFEVEQLPYSTNTPYITHMNESGAYVPVFIGEINEFGPSFEMPHGLNSQLQRFPPCFSLIPLLHEWTEATNAYVIRKKR